MNSTPHAFVISLAESTERRAKIAARLEQLGMEFEFVDGIDLRGTDIHHHPEYDGAKRRRFFGRDLEPGELGCLLSHRKVYERMVSRNLSHALVLEDDAGLADDLPAVSQALVASPVEWDLIRFLDKKKVLRKKCRHIGMLDATHEIARLPTNSGGAYGYLLNLHAAARLLTLMEKNWLQNDVLHSRSWFTGLTTYIVRPSPVTHPAEGEDDSTIGAKRFDKESRLSAGQRAARLGMKLQDQFRKRLHYLSCLRLDRENRRKAGGRVDQPDRPGLSR